MNQCFERIKFFMIKALEEARKSYSIGNTPVGAVLVCDNFIISKSFNAINDAIGHAEILCINEGCKLLQKRYLNDCELFITLEPCNMCYSAILLSRIKQVFFGAFSNEVFVRKNYSNSLEVGFHGGFLERECSFLIENFFKNRRNDFYSRV